MTMMSDWTTLAERPGHSGFALQVQAYTCKHRILKYLALSLLAFRCCLSGIYSWRL